MLDLQNGLLRERWNMVAVTVVLLETPVLMDVRHL